MTSAGHIYSGILFNFKKGDPAICNTMDGPGRHGKWNKPDTERKNIYI